MPNEPAMSLTSTPPSMIGVIAAMSSGYRARMRWTRKGLRGGVAGQDEAVRVLWRLYDLTA